MVYFYPEIFLNRHKEEQFLKSTNIEIDSLDILQELFVHIFSAAVLLSSEPVLSCKLCSVSYKVFG